ncbi:polymorphic toxin type 33 domain-containing protein [Campylobacter majalis]
MKKGGVDPHDLKPHSDYDLYKDKKGNIVIKLKNGKGQGEYTGYNINDF